MQYIKAVENVKDLVAEEHGNSVCTEKTDGENLLKTPSFYLDAINKYP